MYNAEQLQAARRTQIETMLSLTGKAFEGVERLVELNLRTAKSAINEASQATIAALSARDMQSLIDVQANSVQPVADKATAYSRDLYEIVASTSAEISRLAEASASEVQRRILSAIDAASAQVQATAQNAAGAVKTSAEAGKDVYETLQNAAAQGAAAAQSATESTVIATADAAVKNVQAAQRTKRNVE